MQIKKLVGWMFLIALFLVLGCSASPRPQKTYFGYENYPYTFNSWDTVFFDRGFYNYWVWNPPTNTYIFKKTKFLPESHRHYNIQQSAPPVNWGKTGKSFSPPPTAPVRDQQFKGQQSEESGATAGPKFHPAPAKSAPPPRTFQPPARPQYQQAPQRFHQGGGSQYHYKHK